jgi:hypothetical protein
MGAILPMSCHDFLTWKEEQSRHYLQLEMRNLLLQDFFTVSQ